MFSYIKGTLEVKSLNYIVVDVNGIGFKIFMSQSAIQRLEETGKTVKIFTYMNVKEDELSLYGFITNEELRMFELLLSVSGVGAKTALTMLAVCNPSEFALAVISDDVATLTRIPGIGPKSAKRIILELKDKLKKEESISKETNEDIKVAVADDNKVQEAIAALQVLGYNKREIEKAFMKIDKTSLETEDLIKKGLIILSN